MLVTYGSLKLYHTGPRNASVEWFQSPKIIFRAKKVSKIIDSLYVSKADQGVTEIPIWQPPTPAEETSSAAAADVPDLEDASRALTVPEKSRPDERPRRKSSNIRNEIGENDFSAPPSSKLEQVMLI